MQIVKGILFQRHPRQDWAAPSGPLAEVSTRFIDAVADGRTDADSATGLISFEVMARNTKGERITAGPEAFREVYFCLSHIDSVRSTQPWVCSVPLLAGVARATLRLVAQAAPGLRLTASSTPLSGAVAAQHSQPPWPFLEGPGAMSSVPLRLTGLDPSNTNRGRDFCQIYGRTRPEVVCTSQCLNQVIVVETQDPLSRLVEPNRQHTHGRPFVEMAYTLARTESTEFEWDLEPILPWRRAGILGGWAVFFDVPAPSGPGHYQMLFRATFSGATCYSLSPGREDSDAPIGLTMTGNVWDRPAENHCIVVKSLAT